MEFGGTCWRCQAITVDYKTGKKAEGDEGLVWKKLAADRRVDKGWKYGPVFGKYSYTARKDYGKEIRAGDEIVLTKRVKERPVFGKLSGPHKQCLLLTRIVRRLAALESGCFHVQRVMTLSMGGSLFQ
jgi:hypothetical protein